MYGHLEIENRPTFGKTNSSLKISKFVTLGTYYVHTYVSP
jgi:hypothetical protein